VTCIEGARRTSSAVRVLELSYEGAALAARGGTCRQSAATIATPTRLSGLFAGAGLATVCGVLTEVVMMLVLVRICPRTPYWFAGARTGAAAAYLTAGT
jgi:ACR3 family arsenite transporter